MKEHLTSAIVLNVKPYKEYDRRVELYTKDFGLLKVKVIGGRKILSKLSPHLDVGSLIRARFVQKSQFTLVDALEENKFPNLKKDAKKAVLVFRLLFLIRSLVPEAVPDSPFWHFFLRSLREGRIDLKIFLKLLGYNPTLAECDHCRSRNPAYFHVLSQIFLCGSCSFRFPSVELLFIQDDSGRN